MIALLLVLVLLASGGPCATSFGPYAIRPSVGAIRLPSSTSGGLQSPLAFAGRHPYRFHHPLANPLNARGRSDDAIESSDSGEYGGSGAAQSRAVERAQSIQLLGKLSRGIVPLSVSIGFLAAPSTKLAAKVTGAAIGGMAGMVARHYLRKNIGSKAVATSATSDDSSVDLPPRVAAALRIVAKQPSVLSLDLNRLETIAAKNRVDERNLELFFTYVLMEAVLEATRGDSFDLTDLGGLFDFIRSVGFTSAEIGHGLALAAISLRSQLQKDERGFFTADYPPEVFLQACKVFFLADKLLGAWDDYYGGGVHVALSCFTDQQYKAQITRESTRLFQRCVDSVLADPDAFSAEELAQLRTFLTATPVVSDLRPEDMQAIVLGAVHAALDRMVRLASHRAPPLSPLGGGNMPLLDDPSVLDTRVEGLDKLRRAQEVLGWDVRELAETVETRTLPLFERVVQSLFHATSVQPSHAANLSLLLQERIASLHIDPSTARKVLLRTISDLNTDYMQQLEHVYTTSSGSLPAVYKIMAAYAHAHAGWVDLVRPVLQGASIPLPGLPFTEDIRKSLFELDLSHHAATATASASAARPPAQAQLTQDLLALPPEVQTLVRRNLAVPKVASWIRQCIQEGSFHERARAAYQHTLDELHVPPATWTATAADFYYQEVSKIADHKAVPSAEDMSRLHQLRDFLGLDSHHTLVQDIHLDVLGGKYTKAVAEALASSGGLADEYREGLERLRTRLGLDAHSGAQLRAVVAHEHLLASLRGLVELWKADRQPSRSPAASPPHLGFLSSPSPTHSPSPAPAASPGWTFMHHVEHLVEAMHTVRGGQPLPLTAVGEAMNVTDLAGLFRHFVSLRMSEADPVLQQRYARVEPRFADLLGLDEPGQQQVRESLAFAVFKAALERQLARQETVPPQLLGQFAMLRDRLQLSQAASEKVYAMACKAAVLAHVREIIDRQPKNSPVQMNPERARRLREQVQSLGLSMHRDSALSTTVLALLFALEVRYLVDHDAMSELAEIREAYAIPEARAAELVESVCARYLDQVLNLALKCAKRYEEEDCIRYTTEVLRYAPLVPGPVKADRGLFSEADKERLVSFYLADMDARDEAGGGQETGSKQEVSALLRGLIVLSKDYVGPRQGMDGLLGLLPDLEERARNLDKNTWAWG